MLRIGRKPSEATNPATIFILVVENLPSKHNTLFSNPVTPKNKKQKILILAF
jgi:hypothetical protein